MPQIKKLPKPKEGRESSVAYTRQEEKRIFSSSTSFSLFLNSIFEFVFIKKTCVHKILLYILSLFNLFSLFAPAAASVAI